MLRALIISTFLLIQNSWACSYPDDPQLAQQQRECSENDAKRWDCNLNRCVNTEKTVETRQEFQACQGLESAEATKECVDNLANKNLEDAGGELVTGSKNKGKEKVALGINTIFTAMLALNLVAKKGKGSNCTSATIAGATAGVGVLSHLYLNTFAKKQVKKLRKNYAEEEIQEGDAYNMQVRAFEYLKSEQKAVADYAGKKKGAYTLLTLGYTAALGFATYETLTTPKCKSGGASESDTGTETAEPSGEEATGADAPAAVAKASKGFFGFMKSPPGIMIISGLGAFFSKKLASAASKEKKQAEENIEKIEQILANFKESVAGHCAQGRDRLEEPRCYCYLADGSRNNDRSNSGTCQQLWEQDSKNFNVAAADYTRGSISDVKGCRLLSGEFDPSCRCQRLVNSKGENACFKSNLGTVALNGLGQSLGTSTFSRSVDDISSGRTDFGNLNANTLGQQATRNTQINDQLLKRTNLQRKKEGKPALKPLTPALIENFARKLAPKNAIDSLARTSPGLLAARPQGGQLAKAIDSAAKKSAVKNANKSLSLSPAATSRSSSSKKNDNFNFRFNDSARKGTQSLQGFMDKEYDYKENDITKREDVSIWKVISHRYTQSGLRRLFDGETSLPTQKAAQ